MIFSKKVTDNRKSNRKAKNQKPIFEEIWNERPHNCELCGKYILEAKAHNFSHIKPKGMYPELKFDKANIRIECFECHWINTFGGNYNGINYD